MRRPKHAGPHRRGAGVPATRGISNCARRRFFPPGAGVILTGSPRDPSVVAMRAAFEAGDVAAFSAAARLGEHHVPKFPVMTEAEFATRCRDTPIFAHLRFGEKDLITFLFSSPDVPIRIDVFPYNGGPLDLARFRNIEFHLPGVADSLESMVVLNGPRLSPVEQAAVAAIPAGEWERNVIGFTGLTCFTFHQINDTHGLFDAHDVGGVGLVGDTGIGEASRPTILKLLDHLRPNPSVSDLLRARARMIQQRNDQGG